MFWRRSVSHQPSRCSFCLKGEDIAGELIASPANDDPSKVPCYICGECVAVCNRILDDRRREQEDEGRSPKEN